VNKTIELIHLVLRVAVETGALPMVPFELDPAVCGPVRVNEPQTKIRLPSSEKMREVFGQMRIVTTLPEERPELRAYCEARSRDSAASPRIPRRLSEPFGIHVGNSCTATGKGGLK
jgi:hypothetical protein